MQRLPPRVCTLHMWKFCRHHLEPEDRGQSMWNSFTQVSVKYAENRGDEHARNRFRKYLKKLFTLKEDLSLGS